MGRAFPTESIMEKHTKNLRKLMNSWKQITYNLFSEQQQYGKSQATMRSVFAIIRSHNSNNKQISAFIETDFSTIRSQ
jgi:hypothetical protein